MKPKKYDETVQSMKNFLNETIYAPDIFNPSIAYTNARTNTLCGSIYKIAVNNKDPELSEFLFMHEAGHILFAHTKNMDARTDRFLLAKISAAYQRVAKYFDNYNEYINVFKNLIFNVVMDFEVNSRLFDDSEWEFMNKRTQILLGNDRIHGMWPEDFGFGKGLTWNTYLNLILFDPETFIKKIRHMIDRKLSLTQSIAGGKFTIEELEELKRHAGEHNDGTFSIPGQGPGTGRGKSSSGSYDVNFSNYKNMTELLKKISRVLRIKKPAQNRRDQLYYFNRRKYKTDVLISRERSMERTENSKLYILLDVSGSVNARLVHGFVNTFSHFKHNFTQTKFITWDTKLIAQWNVDEPVITRFGFGTNMAPGISYIQNNFNPTSRDTVFVISDFMDNLENWKAELDKMNCNKFAINWDCRKPYMNPGFKCIFQHSFHE